MLATGNHSYRKPSLSEFFIAHLPPVLANSVNSCAAEDKETALGNCFPHLLKKWCAEEVFSHDEEGQATFYKTILPILMENPHLVGAVIYCWTDSEWCCSCDATDCPCETAWVVTRLDGTLKPAYKVVQGVFTKAI